MWTKLFTHINLLKCKDLRGHIQLQALHIKCQIIAKSHRFILITQHPSDLFQVGLSYLHTKVDITLLLHVQVIPEEALQ